MQVIPIKFYWFLLQETANRVEAKEQGLDGGNYCFHNFPVRNAKETGALSLAYTIISQYNNSTLIEFHTI